MEINDENITRAKKYRDILNEIIVINENKEKRSYVPGNINLENLYKERDDLIQSINEFELLIKTKDIKVDTYYKVINNYNKDEIVYIHITEINKAKEGVIKTETIKINKKTGEINPNLKYTSGYYAYFYSLDSLIYKLHIKEVVQIDKEVWDKLKALVKNIKKYLK